MLAKWKTILTNWINCYFNTPAEKQQSVTADALLTIIEHLRDNFNLDESKSSLLEAHTLEEFLLEKYPEFEFSTTDLETGDEIYAVASLLLYFVCVMSKDVNVKNAMCNKLSPEDQEVILKFSRCLMESNAISRKDVDAAVLEACGQDIATAPERRSLIAETPPALRSLHGEVRRLQAALDAERFDRNYLQEELTRSNLRIDKLVKEKEQCKSDILNLRAKISSCCSQECQERAEGGGDSSTQKLLRQLDDMEQRLVDTRAQLDDMVYERDTYKAKVDELKQERDKWLSFGQEENARATQLSTQLETERLNVEGLRELVAELRQHNKHNGLDGSQLECDDPDASVHLAHNASVCSEACANVVEIQLGEERAKILVLQQQIQDLQEQIDVMSRKAEEERLSIHKIVTEKDSDILDLKHRINEEIEEKNKIKSYYSDECMRLNNEINELEQKMKDNYENYTKTLEKKMDEIKTLQEEKLSLLQSLNDETTKLEDIIKRHEATIHDIQADLYTERNSKQSIKEDYENHMMKLKEKVLNRNNECVELQNNVIKKSEEIEMLQCEIRKLNDQKQQITHDLTQQLQQCTNERDNLKREFAQSKEVIQQLHTNLYENQTALEQLSKQFDDLRDVNNNLVDQVKCLEDIKQKLTQELSIRDESLAQAHCERDRFIQESAEQERSHQEVLQDRQAAISSLQTQLEAQYAEKMILQNEIEQLYAARAEMADELSRLSGEYEKVTQAVQEKERIIDGIDLVLNEEREANNKLKTECQALKDASAKLNQQIKENDDEIRALRNVLDNELKCHNEDNNKKDELIDRLNQDKDELTNIMFVLEQDKKNLLDEVQSKTNDVILAQEKCSQLNVTLQELDSELKSLQQCLKEQHNKYDELQEKYNKDTSKLTNRVSETERILKELRTKSNKSIEENKCEIANLQKELEVLEETHKNDREKAAKELAAVNREWEQIMGLVAQMKIEANTKLEEFKALQEQYQTMRENCEGLQLGLDELQTQLQMEVDKNTNLVRERDEAIMQLYMTKSRLEKLLSLDNCPEMLHESDATDPNVKLEIEYFNNYFVEKITDKLYDFERQKIELKNSIDEKEKLIQQLEEQLTAEKNTLNLREAEHEMVLKQSLDVENDRYENLDHERLVLADQLAEERAFVEDLQFENQTLATKLDEVKGLFNEEQSQRKLISDKRDALVTEVETLNSQIAQTNEQIAKMKHDNAVFNKEMEILNKLYHDEVDLRAKVQKENEQLIEDKEMLTQQLLEEKSTKDVVLLEKDALLEEKCALFVEKETLLEELSKEKSVKDSIETEKVAFLKENESLINQLAQEVDANSHLKSSAEKFIEDMKTYHSEIQKINERLLKEMEVKESLEREQEKLKSDNKELSTNLEDEKAKVNILVQEKQIIMTEKEELLKDMTQEKAVRDQIENEKTTQVVKLEEECKKHIDNVNKKSAEITKMCTELKCLKEELNVNNEKSAKITSAIAKGLKRIQSALKKEAIQNDLLNKLTSTQFTDMSVIDQFDLLLNITKALQSEVAMKHKIEKVLKHEKGALNELRELVKQKEMQIHDMQAENKLLQTSLNENKAEQARKSEAYAASLEETLRHNNHLQQENLALSAELNDVKLQLELKVHSLKEKLTDNENLTDKLKATYECQIENLNVMSNKLTNYLKDKASELDALRKEKEKLQLVIEENIQALKSQEEEIKSLKQVQEKLITDFESERLVLKNMVSVTESVMEDQKTGLDKIIADHKKAKDILETENREIKHAYESEKFKLENVIKEKEVAFDTLFKELKEERCNKESLCERFETEINELKVLIDGKDFELMTLKNELKELIDVHEKEIGTLTKKYNDLKIQTELMSELLQKKESELFNIVNEKQQIESEKEAIQQQINIKDNKILELESQNSDSGAKIALLNKELAESVKEIDVLKVEKYTLESEKKNLGDQFADLLNEHNVLEIAKNNLDSDIHALKTKNNTLETEKNQLEILRNALETENNNLEAEKKVLETEKNNLETARKTLETENNNLEAEKSVAETENYNLKTEKNNLETVRNVLETEKLDSTQKLEELIKLQKENSELLNIVEEKQSVISQLEQQIASETQQNQELRNSNTVKQNLESKCALLEEYQRKAEKHLEEREEEVRSLQREVVELKSQVEVLQTQLNDKNNIISKVSKELFEEKAAKDKLLKQLETKTGEVASGREEVVALKRENYGLKASVPSQDKGRLRHSSPQQVDMSTSDLASSLDSNRTITDLERIIHDKNRAITTLQSDITYIKTLMAESENKLLDVTKELELTKETNQQLSSQLKKIVHQKNEEIAELKKQVSKMSVTENRVSQIIKVSAKYQAIILKRIAEIKSNTVLKELTNFGNTQNIEDELRKSIAGSVTMEDLENFLETTDRHLKRCSEKQVLLQKERDRLAEVNKINESEIINMKKFLTELSVSFKTFNSVKDVYTQKLSRVVAVQRTVRREILNLDGSIVDAVMCKLERGYAAVMQDLTECVMNLERWMDRCVSRTISPEKIKQAYTSEIDRASIASGTFQNTSLEVQFEELEKSFQKLLEEVLRASKGEGAKDAQATTVMEVRAEYEDKLNRMKAKMKQLYQEQISIFREKQKEEIASLEKELLKAREKLVESSRGYEEHIRGLTTELWNVGEKFLVKQDEADWLRRQKHPSLRSLQNLPQAAKDEPRQSDASSLRSLPVHHHTMKPERRKNTALHMSDEEGEVFDNRWLKDLSATPRSNRSPPPRVRLSELRWRNSLCPPHLKSSYPAETQFAGTVNEEDIKCVNTATSGRPSVLRKEVGITAYKKPGPPTPSKNAGRLSATDSELRESLRPDPDAAATLSRKTTTPSRIRALFFSSKNDTNEGTPRRRLSIFRNKK